MKPFFVLTVISAIVLSSCNFIGGRRVSGDGNITTQARTASNFNGVEVSGAIDLYITQDPGYSVKVEADDNLQELVEVYADGNVLHVHPRNNFNLQPSRDIKVFISAPSYKFFHASGACKVSTENRVESDSKIKVDLSGASDADLDIKAPDLDLELSGASNAWLKGETKNLRVEGSGAMHVKAFELMSETADVDISGASSVEVFASRQIQASGSGASEIRYKGNPTVNSNTSGASSVKKAD